MTIDEIAQKAANRLDGLVPITDDDVMPFLQEAYEAGQKNPVKRIVGIDGYFEVPDRPVAPVELPPDFGKVPEPESSPFFGDGPIDPDKVLPDDLPIAPVEDDGISLAVSAGIIEPHIDKAPSPAEPVELETVPEPGTPVEESDYPESCHTTPPVAPVESQFFGVGAEEKRQELQEQLDAITPPPQPRPAKEVAFDLIGCAKTHEEDNRVLFDGFDVKHAASLITKYGDERVRVAERNYLEAKTACRLIHEGWQNEVKELKSRIATLIAKRDALKARVGELKQEIEDQRRGPSWPTTRSLTGGDDGQ